MKILAIDPGTTDSAYVVLDSDLRPTMFGKIPNGVLLQSVYNGDFHANMAAIEMIASYGMAVGREVFETCVWIGRFTEAIERQEMSVQYIYRKDEKLNLCGSVKAKDSNIRQALIDRFARHDFKNGKGNKSNPDWFYGFSKDVWAAMAVATTYYDMHVK